MTEHAPHAAALHDRRARDSEFDEAREHVLDHVLAIDDGHQQLHTRGEGGGVRGEWQLYPARAPGVKRCPERRLGGLTDPEAPA